MRSESPNLLDDILTALEVPHTRAFTASQYQAMPFKTVFGLSKALRTFGVDTDVLQLTDKSQFAELPVPFTAHAAGHFIVVLSFGADSVRWLERGKIHTSTREHFMRMTDGIVLMAYPSDNAAEPSYTLHRSVDMAIASKKWVALAAAAILTVYLALTRGIFFRPALLLLVIADLAGIFVSLLLVRKELGFSDRAADSMCGVLRAGGCDDIMRTAASKFYGIFGWSEVGLAYFGISLSALLLFPSQWQNLALVNLCCLPYSFWSVWYQRTRAHTWCTLCICVQTLLWIQFLLYLCAGLWSSFSIGWNILPLICSYVAALLGINALVPVMTRKQ